MSLVIDVSPELRARLEAAARERGMPVGEYARRLLEDRVPNTAEPSDAGADYAGLPRRSPEDLDALALAQGASLNVDWAGMQPNFWPEDETCDEFTAAVREWRRDSEQRVLDAEP